MDPLSYFYKLAASEEHAIQYAAGDDDALWNVGAALVPGPKKLVPDSPRNDLGDTASDAATDKAYGEIGFGEHGCK
jgi:hypothetical protein